MRYDTSVPEEIKYQKPKSLVETVSDYLRESIVNGALKPGQRLNNKEIMRTLGVSNIPLREAVRVLEQEGLIDSRSGRGFWITSISRKDMLETFEMREMMETYAVRLIERRVQNDGRVAEELDRVAVAEKSQGPHAHPSGNFHLQLLQISQNQRLLNAYMLLSNSVLRYQKLSFALRHQNKTRENEHTPIITALCEGRYEEAKSEICQHLCELKIELLEHLNPEFEV